MGDRPPKAYVRLGEIAESEYALVAAGHFDELAVLWEERSLLTAGLPAVPPKSAEPILRRVLALSEQTQDALRSAQDDIARELGSVGQSRAVGRAYTPPTGVPEPRSVDFSA